MTEKHFDGRRFVDKVDAQLLLPQIHLVLGLDVTAALIAQPRLLVLRPPPSISALHLISASLHVRLARLLPLREFGHLVAQLRAYSALSRKSLRAMCAQSILCCTPIYKAVCNKPQPAIENPIQHCRDDCGRE